MQVGGSIFLIAVGAILRYALNVNVAGVDIDTVGLILMIAGAALLVISFAVMIFNSEDRRRGDVVGIDAVIAISAMVGDPASAAAIGHGNRHLVAAGREHAPERRLCDDLAERRDQFAFEILCEAAQQHRPLRHHFT